MEDAPGPRATHAAPVTPLLRDSEGVQGCWLSVRPLHLRAEVVPLDSLPRNVGRVRSSPASGIAAAPSTQHGVPVAGVDGVACGEGAHGPGPHRTRPRCDITGDDVEHSETSILEWSRALVDSQPSIDGGRIGDRLHQVCVAAVAGLDMTGAVVSLRVCQRLGGRRGRLRRGQHGRRGAGAEPGRGALARRVPSGPTRSGGRPGRRARGVLGGLHLGSEGTWASDRCSRSPCTWGARGSAC